MFVEGRRRMWAISYLPMASVRMAGVECVTKSRGCSVFHVFHFVHFYLLSELPVCVVALPGSLLLLLLLLLLLRVFCFSVLALSRCLRFCRLFGARLDALLESWSLPIFPPSGIRNFAISFYLFFIHFFETFLLWIFFPFFWRFFKFLGRFFVLVFPSGFQECLKWIWWGFFFWIDSLELRWIFSGWVFKCWLDPLRWFIVILFSSKLTRFRLILARIWLGNGRKRFGLVTDSDLIRVRMFGVVDFRLIETALEMKWNEMEWNGMEWNWEVKCNVAAAFRLQSCWHKVKNGGG